MFGCKALNLCMCNHHRSVVSFRCQISCECIYFRPLYPLASISTTVTFFQVLDPLTYVCASVLQLDITAIELVCLSQYSAPCTQPCILCYHSSKSHNICALFQSHPNFLFSPFHFSIPDQRMHTSSTQICWSSLPHDIFTFGLDIELDAW